MGRENNSFTGFFSLSQKNIYFMEWRKSAHGVLYLALILLLSEQHHVFKFAVKSCAPLVWWALPHVNICDYHFFSSNLLYHHFDSDHSDVNVNLSATLVVWSITNEKNSAWITYPNMKTHSFIMCSVMFHRHWYWTTVSKVWSLRSEVKRRDGREEAECDRTERKSYEWTGKVGTHHWEREDKQLWP